MWWVISANVYALGFASTLAYNLNDVVFVSRPFVVLRNAIFWPVFLPILIALKE